MKTDDVDIVGSKLSVINAARQHIEWVFNVGVSLPKRNDGDFLLDENNGVCEGVDSATIRLSSDFSQENIQEAKNYIGSLTAEGDERKAFSEVLNDFQASMLKEHLDSLEKRSQAVMDVNQESQILYVFGKLENVRSAELMINLMLNKNSDDSRLNIRTRGGTEDKDDERVHVLDEMRTKQITSPAEPDVRPLQCSSEDDDICCSENFERTFSNEDDSSLQTDCEPPCQSFVHDVMMNVDFSDSFTKRGCDAVTNKNVEDAVEDAGDLTVDTDVTGDLISLESNNRYIESQLTHLNLSSPCEHKSSSDEEIERLHGGVEYCGKMEFALKLGYTESQLTTVIDKLGQDASQNEILSELIKLGKCGNPDDGVNLESLDPDGDLKSDDTGIHSAPLSSRDASPDDAAQEMVFVDKFRPVVIDGSNVAMSHGNKELFSCRGIALAVDWFKQRGHSEITVFVPQWRKETSRPDAKIKDQEILTHLEKEKVLVFTPARRIGGKRVVCYDDRYVLKLAAETGGIVVSNDNYRDLLNENPEYKKVVEERLLMYSFVNDRFMPPDDPLGRHGPSLDNFLSREPTVPESLPPVCPYGSKKCTYGNKCKFYHPERGNMPQKSVTEKLAEQAKQKIQDLKDRGSKGIEGDKRKAPIRKQPLKPKLSLQRTKSLVVPVDGAASRPPPDFSDLAADDPPLAKTEDTSHSSEKKEKWKSYDDKLTEYRKKMEQAEQEEKQRQEEVPSPDVESTKKISSGTESLHMLGTNEQVNSRSSSPLHRGSPTHPIKPQEQFLSGHLLLAKKLSDEAADKKARKSVPEDRDHTRTPPIDLQQSRVSLHRCSSPLAQYSQPQIQNQPVSHQIPSPEQQPQPRHQKLSRQLSLQGAHDARAHRALHQQWSYDPRFSSQQAYHGPPPPVQGRHQAFLDVSMADNMGSGVLGGQDSRMSHPMQNMSQQDTRTFTDPFFSSGSGRQITMEHTTVARMQSAPEVPQLRNAAAASSMARMVRQNSSSDTQLHIMGGEMDPTNYNFSEFQGIRSDFHQGDAYSSNYVARGPGFEVHQHHQPVGHQYHRGMVHGPQMFQHGQVYMHQQPQQQPQKHHAGNTTWSFGDQGFAPGQIKQPAHYPGFVRHAPIQHSRGYQTMHPRQQSKEPFSERDQSFHTGILTQREDDIWGPSVASSSSSGFSAQMYSHDENRYGDIPLSQAGSIPQVSQHQQSSSTEKPRGNMGQSNISSSSQNRTNPGIETLPSAPVYAEDAPIHPSDSRYSLYYHLCGLFPEQKVRTVMNQHPEETDPQELCAYIIGAK